VEHEEERTWGTPAAPRRGPTTLCCGSPWAGATGLWAPPVAARRPWGRGIGAVIEGKSGRILKQQHLSLHVVGFSFWTEAGIHSQEEREVQLVNQMGSGMEEQYSI
jgi:hypothetical protein